MAPVDEQVDLPAPTAAKQDPESLVLRGRPRPVVRFRRGLIIGVAAVGLAGFAGVAWLAFQPPTFRAVAEGENGAPLRKGTPDALAAAPASYGDVPRLGPPLPGDLGRPILKHQRSVTSAGQPTGHPTVEIDPAVTAREAERQRLLAAQEAARSSAVLVQLGGSSGNRPAPDEPVRAMLPVSVADGETLPAPPSAKANGQDRKLEFTRSALGEVSSHRLVEAPSPWVLSAGTIIPASLLTGLNSDLPGMVLAQVTEHVRDSAMGSSVLIPQGSRLVGRYDSVVAFGQRRALIVWQRIILPDGASIQLDNMPATDASGYAGVEDRVDFHTWRLITGIGLSTLLGVGTELSVGSGEGDLVRALRESAQQNAARAGDQLTQRNLQVQPTLRVRPGWPLRAMIHKDLVLRPWKNER